MGVVPYRDQSRRLLRESLIEAARELTVARGWAGVTMGAVATRAGLSRQTVYNEFGGKPGMAEALAAHEIDRFVAAVRTDLAAHGPDVPAAARAAILHALTEAAGNPLVKAIITSARGGADELLPFLTTRADVVLDAATAVILEWAAGHRPDLDEPALRLAAESVVRLTISHIMLPTAAPEPTAAALAGVFVRLLGLPPDT